MPPRPLSSPPDPSLLPSRTEKSPSPIIAMPQGIVDVILGYFNQKKLLMMRLVHPAYRLKAIPFLLTSLTFEGGVIYSRPDLPNRRKIVQSPLNGWLLLSGNCRGMVDYTDIPSVVDELNPLIKNVKTSRFSPAFYRSYAKLLAPCPPVCNFMSLHPAIGLGKRFVYVPFKQKAEI
jgi:hypothetical protein